MLKYKCPTLFYKKNRWIWIVIGLLLLSFVSIFPISLQSFIYNQDDLPFHKLRLEGYFQSVASGDLFPKIFYNMANGSGYGADLFYPSILLLPYALLRIIGLPFVQAYFTFQFFLSFQTALFAYLFMQKVSHNQEKSWLFTTIYTLSTYRLLDQSVRGALGETQAFAYLPIAMLGLYYIFFTNQERRGVAPLVIGMSLLLCSHFITSFMFALFILGYLIFAKDTFLKKKIQFFSLAISGIWTFFLTSWLLLPILEQTLAVPFNFGNGSLWSIGLNFSLATLIQNSLTTLSGVWSNLQPSMGIFLLIVAAISIFYFKKVSKKTQHLIFISFFLLILSTNLFPWSLFQHSFLKFIQFPWRILLFVSFFFSLVAVSIWEEKMNKWKKSVPILTGIICLLSISFTSNALYQFQSIQTNQITNENYETFQTTALGGGKEYLVAGTNYDQIMQLDQKNITPITALEAIKTLNVERYQNGMIVTLDSQKTTTFQTPFLYYKGYQALDKNGTVYHASEKEGRVTFTVPKGQHSLTIRYQKTWIQHVSGWLSLIAWILFLLWIFTIYHKQDQWKMAPFDTKRKPTESSTI